MIGVDAFAALRQDDQMAALEILGHMSLARFGVEPEGDEKCWNVVLFLTGFAAGGGGGGSCGEMDSLVVNAVMAFLGSSVPNAISGAISPGKELKANSDSPFTVACITWLFHILIPTAVVVACVRESGLSRVVVVVPMIAAWIGIQLAFSTWLLSQKDLVRVVVPYLTVLYAKGTLTIVPTVALKLLDKDSRRR